MSRPRVLVTEGIHPIGIERLAREVEPIYLPDHPGETAKQYLPEVEGIIVRTFPLSAETLRGARKLRVIGKHGVGVDNIDLAAARAQGIRVVSTPGANAEAVAEHALMLMLVLARRLPTYQQMLREGHFALARRSALAMDLQGRILGLVGLGQVGGRLARICRQGLGMRVLAYDPYVARERADELGVELMPALGPVLEAADVLSIHAPLTPETRGLIGREEMARMKPSAILINCARGGLVDEEALLEALRAGRLAGAGLDVFAEEPVSPEHPLLRLPNVVATPHVAGSSAEAFRLMAETVAEDVLRVLRGEAPLYPLV
jgi:D-3-phosphoglycerate dehydrogenase